MSTNQGLIIAVPERWDEAAFAIPALLAFSKANLLSAIVCREEQQIFWNTVSLLPLITYSHKTNPSVLAGQISNMGNSSLAWDAKIPAIAFSKANIAKRIGPCPSPLAKFFTHPIPFQTSHNEHRVRYYINTALHLDIQVNQPEFFMPAPLGIAASPDSVLLCPESDFGPSHEWPLDRWQELAETLLQYGKKITIACSISKRDLGKILASRLSNDADIFHASPLAASLPILASHQIIIAADGSLPHLAAHAGSTCVTLFGPNDPTWKRPLGKHHVVLKKHVECAPCLSQKCFLDLRCQNELQVSTVIAAIPSRF